MSSLETLLAHEIFTTLDRHLARAIVSAAKPADHPEAHCLLGYAAALASAALRHGHICLELSDPPDFFDSDSPVLTPWPDLKIWRASLEASGVVAKTDAAFLPLVLDDDGRLYLHRYREYETELVAAISHLAATRRVQLIVGGPGTGKTTRILQEIASFVARNPESHIVLAAPTGKAATRMEESIRTGLTKLDASQAVRERIPQTASTLHRLLGSRGDSAFFRHHVDNPLPADLVIIDEASMVDLPLMAKLFRALKPTAELILVGDPDQLASVEAGAVLADIATAAQSSSADHDLGRALITLDKQFRYSTESGIGRLCNAIRAGDGEAAAEILNGKYPDVRLRSLPDRHALAERLSENEAVRNLFKALGRVEPGEILQGLGRGRILCPTRLGPYGVETINEIIEKSIVRSSLQTNDKNSGRPIVLTRNDYGLQLFNGDSGVVLSELQNGTPQAFFIGRAGDVRRLPIVRLPPNETAYAMTVHRSQGSEFDQVLIILPPIRSPVLTRELLYTAVSRARADVEIWGDPEILRWICTRRVRRASGLAARLV